MAKAGRRCPCNGYKIEIVPGLVVHSKYLYKVVNLGDGQVVTVCMNGNVVAPGVGIVTNPEAAMAWRQRAADAIRAKGEHLE